MDNVLKVPGERGIEDYKVTVSFRVTLGVPLTMLQGTPIASAFANISRLDLYPSGVSILLCYQVVSVIAKGPANCEPMLDELLRNG